MIPLRDSRRPRRAALVTWCLAALCVAAFGYQLSLGVGAAGLLDRLGVVPAALLAPRGPAAVLDAALRLVAALFLHGSLLHLVGNVAFLLVFGDDVEERLGRLRFLAFYLTCGVAASFGQALAAPRSTTPMIGASGAIAGLLGAFLVMYPKARISGVLPLGCLLVPARSPAYLYLPLWFLIQAAAAFLEIGRLPGGDPRGGIAWYAHLTGFLAGPPLALLLRRR